MALGFPARRVAARATVTLALLVTGGVPRVAAQPAHAPLRAPKRSVYLVPRLPGEGSGVPALWDTLDHLDQAQRWVSAESLATLRAQRLEHAPPVDSLALSRALMYAGVGRLKQRMFADGVGLGTLERALGIRARRAPPGDPLLAWGHMYAGLLAGDAGQPERAIAHAETAARLILSATPIDSSRLAQNWLTLATAHQALGQLDAARAAYETALRVRAATDGEGRSLVPMIAEYGMFLTRSGEFDAARALLHRAVRLSSADPGAPTDFLEASLARLSTLEDQAGNVAESLELAQRAYELARARVGDDAVATTRMRTIVAYRLDELGDSRGTAALLREIVPRMEATLGPTNPQTLNARLVLANNVLIQGDTATAARQLAAMRVAIVGERQLANSNLAMSRQLAADLERARGHEAAARETLRVAIAEEWAKRDPRADNLSSLFLHLLVTAHRAADRPLVEQAGREIDRLRDSTRALSTELWPQLVAARAGAEGRVGLREPAWGHALEAERLARERLGYQLEALPDARALRLAQQLGTACDLLVRLMRADREGEVAGAWDRIVRWRGWVGHEIARRRTPAAAASDTALAAAHTRWIEAQRRLGQLVVSGAAHPQDPGTAARFEAARREADDAEGRYVHLAGVAVAPDTASLERVLAQLGPDQALVGFATGSLEAGDTVLGAFVATGRDRRARWVECGPLAAVESEVGAWMHRLARPPSSAADARAADRSARVCGVRVRARVWDPILRATGPAREILLVSEGAVAGLPWLALPAAGGRYLADEPRRIRVLDAERDLLPRPAAPAARGLLAVGGPDFDRDGGVPAAAPALAQTLRARTWPCTGSEPLALPALPAALTEAEEIARRWPASEGAAELLVGAQAGEAAVKRAAPGHAVIHIATHGVVVEDTCGAPGAAGLRGVGGIEPITSGTSRRRTSQRAAAAAPPQATRWLGRQVWLALSGANRPATEARDENEGLLTAEEVVTLDLRGTDWVVLSACHSALGTAWAREGVLGMRRAFHLAGARAVIASQWTVADEATREWMRALYAARAGGATRAADAIAGACRSVLAARRRAGRPTHPFYWAAFTATEDN